MIGTAIDVFLLILALALALGTWFSKVPPPSRLVVGLLWLSIAFSAASRITGASA